MCWTGFLNANISFEEKKQFREDFIQLKFCINIYHLRVKNLQSSLISMNLFWGNKTTGHKQKEVKNIKKLLRLLNEKVIFDIRIFNANYKNYWESAGPWVDRT